jgi:hypothetical protein
VRGCSIVYTEAHGWKGIYAAERGRLAVWRNRVGLTEARDIAGEDAGTCWDARSLGTTQRDRCVLRMSRGGGLGLRGIDELGARFAPSGSPYRASDFIREW